MSYSYPSPTNVFIQSDGFRKSGDASGNLIVNFSRKPSSFPTMKWVSLTPVKKTLGLYMRMTLEQAARVLNTNLDDASWADGSDMPSGKDELESFSFFPYSCNRVAFPFQVGYKTMEQANWDIIQQNANIVAARAMTSRCVKIITKALDTTQYDSANVSTATALVGGYLTTGTTSTPVIKTAFRKMAIQINVGTLGVVSESDLHIVMNPNMAGTLAETAEIHNYLAQSPFAKAEVEEGGSENSRYGLPSKLYGYNVVIDDTVKVTTAKGVTTSRSYAFPNTTIGMFARPGGLTSNEGGMSFSTVHVFSLEEMTVETKDDADNRRHIGRVVEDMDVQVVAPVSGYLLTSAIAGT